MDTNGALKELMERHHKDIVSFYNGSCDGNKTIVSVQPKMEHILIRNESCIMGVIAASAVDDDLIKRLRKEKCILIYYHPIAYVPTENGILMCINNKDKNGDLIEDSLKTGCTYNKVEL